MATLPLFINQPYGDTLNRALPLLKESGLYSFQFVQINPEKLISMVESRPCIFIFSVVNYDSGREACHWLHMLKNYRVSRQESYKDSSLRVLLLFEDLKVPIERWQPVGVHEYLFAPVMPKVFVKKLERHSFKSIYAEPALDAPYLDENNWVWAFSPPVNKEQPMVKKKEMIDGAQLYALEKESKTITSTNEENSDQPYQRTVVTVTTNIFEQNKDNWKMNPEQKGFEDQWLYTAPKNAQNKTEVKFSFTGEKPKFNSQNNTWEFKGENPKLVCHIEGQPSEVIIGNAKVPKKGIVIKETAFFNVNEVRQQHFKTPLVIDEKLLDQHKKVREILDENEKKKKIIEKEKSLEKIKELERVKAQDKEKVENKRLLHEDEFKEKEKREFKGLTSNEKLKTIPIQAPLTPIHSSTSRDQNSLDQKPVKKMDEKDSPLDFEENVKKNPNIILQKSNKEKDIPPFEVHEQESSLNQKKININLKSEENPEESNEPLKNEIIKNTSSIKKTEINKNNIEIRKIRRPVQEENRPTEDKIFISRLEASKDQANVHRSMDKTVNQTMMNNEKEEIMNQAQISSRVDAIKTEDNFMTAAEQNLEDSTHKIKDLNEKQSSLSMQGYDEVLKRKKTAEPSKKTETLISEDFSQANEEKSDSKKNQEKNSAEKSDLIYFTSQGEYKKNTPELESQSFLSQLIARIKSMLNRK